MTHPYPGRFGRSSQRRSDRARPVHWFKWSGSRSTIPACPRAIKDIEYVDDVKPWDITDARTCPTCRDIFEVQVMRPKENSLRKTR